MAVGFGSIPNGTALVIPAEMPWFDPHNMLGIVTPQGAFAATNQAHGVNEADFRISGSTVIAWATFEDGSGNIWGDTVNWMAMRSLRGWYWRR